MGLEKQLGSSRGLGGWEQNQQASADAQARQEKSRHGHEYVRYGESGQRRHHCFRIRLPGEQKQDPYSGSELNEAQKNGRSHRSAAGPAASTTRTAADRGGRSRPQ